LTLVDCPTIEDLATLFPTASRASRTSCISEGLSPVCRWAVHEVTAEQSEHRQVVSKVGLALHFGFNLPKSSWYLKKRP